MRFFRSLILAAASTVFLAFAVPAQQTNPVDRQVSNPITDTPNVDPVSQEKSIRTPKNARPIVTQEGGDDEVVVYSQKNSVEGPETKRIVTHTGNVDVRYGIYRLQAEKVVIYEAENKLVAEGSVIFDQGEDQRITGERGEWNYKTKLGKFINSTGFTNQTNDGTVIYFTADLVERVSVDEILIINGKFTACEEATPKWSFTASEARIRQGDRLRLRNAKFKVLDLTLVPLPYASISIKKEDRGSGFLTPSFGYSGPFGARINTAYYKTLGRSADATLRGDLYSRRGIGFGLDVRTRANSRSFFNFGFYAVKDRILGKKADSSNPDQGGSVVYADGVQYFSNGFTAAADVRLTSNLAFRQVFSDGIQQIISPIEVSQVFVNKSWNSYTFNLLARSQVISIPNVRIKTRNLPSINFDKRPSELSFLKNVYFSFKSSLEGVSRREEVDDVGAYVAQTGQQPLVSPALGQRFDIHPQVEIPVYTKYFSLTATVGSRVTYYSNSFDDFRRIVGRDVIRKYGELELDFRPVALARNFYDKKKGFRFRHVIEPFVTYRRIAGVDNYNKIVRFDYADTETDTNEIEYGITNRFYTRTYAQSTTDDGRKNPAAAAAAAAMTGARKAKAASVQPYEVFTLTLRGKYFFDPQFGGALVAGRRNQFAPMTALTFYTFGGVPHRFSPINLDATYRPRRTVFVNTRADLGLNGDGLRSVSAAVGYDKPLLKIFQTFYYTRAVSLIPSLAKWADPAGKESGTLRGSQWSPSVFVGSRDKGLYAGTSLFFDFQNRRATQTSPLISSLYTLGYAYDCCSVALQYYTFNVGARRENRIFFSFKLNGIGAFGTEQFGQGLR